MRPEFRHGLAALMLALAPAIHAAAPNWLGLSAEQQAEVKAAKDTYGKLRSQLGADDITPELYLYSVLQDYLLYDDMRPVVDEMSKRQPTSTEVQELAAWVKSRTQN